MDPSKPTRRTKGAAGEIVGVFVRVPPPPTGLLVVADGPLGT